jgi:hypothetical protein
MSHDMTEEFEIPLEGALWRNEPTDSVSKLKVVDRPLVKPATNGVENHKKAIVPRRIVL